MQRSYRLALAYVEPLVCALLVVAVLLVGAARMANAKRCRGAR